MNEMTAQNLRSAYGGESQAHMRYKVWASKAEQEGFKNVGNLFRAVSYAEEVHAINHFKALKEAEGEFQVTAGAGFGLGSTSENLQGAIDGENFEVEQMYPAFMAVADMQEEKKAKLFMKYAIEAEKTHADLFTKAKEAVDDGKDLDMEEIHVCPVCGYTIGNEDMEKCPVCGVKREKFEIFK